MFNANCIKNKENVKFMGDSNGVAKNLLELRIEKCTGIDCKTEEEIHTFLRDKYLVLGMKDN